MSQIELNSLLESLLALPKETEWVEFKHNFHSFEEVGETLSALSNGACLHNQACGHLIYGAEDGSHKVVGTDFKPSAKKKGNEELEHWIAQRLNPRVDFRIIEFEYNGLPVALFQVDAASNQPIDFMHEAYIRVGSITRKLRDFPEKERKIWRKFHQLPFEKNIAKTSLSDSEVINLLDSQSYFEMLELPYPTTQSAVLKKFETEAFILQATGGWSITNLGAVLFAKSMASFSTVSRKAMRVVVYEGKNKVNTKKDITGVKGYAVGFEGLITFINDQLPSNEVITQTLRQNVKMYPEIAVRELVANALIHQDFSVTGTGPIVEIFDDRIEITNPGQPLLNPLRFIDEYQSRNEILASLMRRLRICEEKGSGVDKVIHFAELFQLPAPDFKVQEKHTKAFLFAYTTLNEMDKSDRIRACYQHCCLRYVSNEKMTNQSLRERFKIEDQNAAIASRIIKETLEAKFIKEDDPENKSRKYTRYIPEWA
jgi:ATP-dependent DNA helicase RecG